MISDTTLEDGLEALEAAFLAGDPDLGSPTEALLLPDTEILPVDADQPVAYDRPTKRTRRRYCCD